MSLKIKIIYLLQTPIQAWVTFFSICFCRSHFQPCVTSLVVIRNQPRFLKLQKEWDRKGGSRKGGKKGGCSRRGTKTEKVAATEMVGKGKSEGKRERGKKRQSFSVVRERNSLRERRLDFFLLEEPGMYVVFSSSLIIH